MLECKYVFNSCSLHFIAHGQDPACFERGECTGSLILDTWPAEDAQECFKRAESTDGAEFFTFHDETGDCTAFANCEIFDTQTCAQCYSGPTDCPGLR